MKSSSAKSVLLLFSGGIDSTACIQYYLDLGYSINPHFFKFGQLSEAMELKSARKICTHYGLNLVELQVQTVCHLASGEIVGRNLMFLANALFNLSSNHLIVLGVHSGTGYYDCSEDFVETFCKIVHESTNGTARLEAPFVKWTKGQILAYCNLKRIPIELAYSCEKGKEIPCGKCATCIDLIVFYGR